MSSLVNTYETLEEEKLPILNFSENGEERSTSQVVSEG